jgi:nucleoside-diphosphate-sugar epimerase
MNRKILITGASGRIGTLITRELGGQYHFVLTDIREPADTYGFPFTPADLADFGAIRPLCTNIHTVIHLGADPRMHAPWESLLPSNIIGLYNILQAAHEAGCQRVIYASSINAVSGYPPDIRVQLDMPVRPANLYGASKAWAKRPLAFMPINWGCPVSVCASAGSCPATANSSDRIILCWTSYSPIKI